MSLRKQLWIAVAVLLMLALMVSIVVSTLSARDYLVQQLHIKNIDNAASLALSLSQLPKDDTTVELQVASQFDTGHYRRIRLVNPDGGVMIERENPAPPQGVPGWFVDLLPLEVRPGVSHISDGWAPFGTLYVESQTSYAYETLWSGTLRLTAIFVLGLFLIGLLGIALLGRLIRPLNGVVEQARALGERRFVTTPEPRTLEFRAVVRAMNRLTEHVRMMLREESSRLEQLQAQLQHDHVTGLLAREPFLAQLQATLDSRHTGSSGGMIVLRIARMQELNQTLGHAGLDALLHRIAEVLRRATEEVDYSAAGRLNGSDLVLFAHGISEPRAYAESLLNAVRTELGPDAPEDLVLYAATTTYHPDDTPGQILARVDQALARAELEPGDTVTEEPHAAAQHGTQAEWRRAITAALDEHGVQLARFPVLDIDNELMHHEAPMRLVLDGEPRPAGYFMPWAVRLNLILQLDEAVLDAALSALQQSRERLAINLSVASLTDTGFRQALEQRLLETPDTAGRLWLEFPARGALAHPAELRDLCRIARTSGCVVGLEHAGPEAFRAHDLSEFGLHYVKLQSSLASAAEGSSEGQALVRGLCTLAHSIGILVIAEGCDTPETLRLMPDLGLDGMTGRAVQHPVG